MKQDVVANAEALSSGIAATGHVEVPRIFFDFHKADIKPESGPALEQVAKLLKKSPVLKVWVVGHTDWVGSAEANTALSTARAAAVVKAAHAAVRHRSRATDATGGGTARPGGDEHHGRGPREEPARGARRPTLIDWNDVADSEGISTKGLRALGHQDSASADPPALTLLEPHP
jgi:hypothetical protein